MLGAMNAVTQAVQGKFNVLRPLLDERTRRLWAAAEARAIGRGGIARVAEATGMSRGTVRAGVRALESATPPAPRAGVRVRAPGGGRKALVDRDPGLVQALEHLLDPFTRGDPQGPLRWTCSSAARLAEQLGAAGHRVSERTVNRLLHELGYSLQANRKTLEGRQHPDRDAQFPAHRAPGAGVSTPGAAGGLDRHEEEGAGRSLPQRRPGMASEGETGGGEGA